MTQFLYLSTVFIWGTTWIAIHWQLGDVAILTSVFYRFTLAAAIMLALVLLSGRLQVTSKQDHGFMVLQGMCMFSLNFVCVYTAGFKYRVAYWRLFFLPQPYLMLLTVVYFGEKNQPVLYLLQALWASLALA